MSPADSEQLKPARPPRIAVLGVARWDHVTASGNTADGEGTQSTWSQPGEAGVQAALLLAALGAQVSFHGRIGDDEGGRQLRSALDHAGVETGQLRSADGAITTTSTILIYPDGSHRVTANQPGAGLRRGDRLDIASAFASDLILLDIDDLPLLRFLLDLPAHTKPTARILGTTRHLAKSTASDRIDLLMRHDAVIGNVAEFAAIAGQIDPPTAIESIRRRMLGENLRALVVTPGDGGAAISTRDNVWRAPIGATDSGHAFTGGIAYAMANRWEWDRALKFAVVVARLTAGGLNAAFRYPPLAESIAGMHGS
jgi:ribokinase